MDAINQAQGSRYRLKIYTAEQDGTILSALQTCKSVELAGFLSGDAFTAAFGHAQLLLHVESFDPQSAEQVKHSVSTKIADSLASGIPLLAYGPEQVASMAHLRRNDCAIGAYSRETLRKALLTAFTDPETCKRAAENALLAASIYHDAAAVSCKLRNIFEGCL